MIYLPRSRHFTPDIVHYRLAQGIQGMHTVTTKGHEAMNRRRPITAHHPPCPRGSGAPCLDLNFRCPCRRTPEGHPLHDIHLRLFSMTFSTPFLISICREEGRRTWIVNSLFMDFTVEAGEKKQTTLTSFRCHKISERLWHEGS